MKFKIPGMKGFSLVEIAIGCAVLAGGSLIVAKQLGETSKSQKRNERMATIDQLAGQINTTLSNRYSCALTLEGIEQNSDIPAIRVGEADPSNRNRAVPVSGRNNPILFERGKEAKSSGIEISNIRLMNRAGQDFIQVTFDPGLQARLTGSQPVLKEFLVTGTKENGKYVSCYAERIDVQAVIREQSCKAMGGEWINNRCNLKNLPRCIVAEGASCLMAAMYGYREVDKVRVGVSKTELKELTKCCREDVAAEPWPTGSPTLSCADTPNSSECVECQNPGPNSASCPTCGPADGLPFWEFDGWSACSSSGVKTGQFKCNPGTAGVGVSCAVACGPAPVKTESCPICPPGTTGAYPNCTPISCPAGMTGTPPNCNAGCTGGKVGTPPNCNDPDCPVGTTGVYPNCIPIEACPTGQIGTPPNCKNPPKDCNVAGQAATWDKCSGSYPANYAEGDQVIVIHTGDEKYKGKLTGKCTNGSIEVISKECADCPGGGTPCANNCPVPATHSWKGDNASCSGTKSVSTLTIGPGETVMYWDDGSNNKSGYAIGTCVKKDDIQWQTSCTKGCELSGDFKWGNCSATLPKTTVTDSNSFIITNSKPDYSGYKIASCKDGKIEFTGELCEEAMKCKVDAATITWQDCSGSIPAGSYASNSSIIVSNTKPDFQGMKVGTCTNGAISWSSETCEQAKPCQLSSPVNWGPACTATPAASYPSNSSIILSNTKEGYKGVKVGSCKNGIVSWDGYSEFCTESAPCNLSGTITWGGGKCSGTAAGTYTSGQDFVISNTKENSQGVKVGSCDNGKIRWAYDDCQEAKPCNPTAYTWGGACNASGGGTMKSGDTRVIQSGVKGWEGALVLTCNNGAITTQDAGCKCVQ